MSSERAPNPSPSQPKPHLLSGEGSLRFRGSGIVCIRLLGSGTLEVKRGPSDSFDFTGRGSPRHFSSGHVALTNAKGLVQIEGEDLDVSLEGAAVNVAITGHFTAEVRGQGIVETQDGKRWGWGLRGKRLYFDGLEATTAA